MSPAAARGVARFEQEIEEIKACMRAHPLTFMMIAEFLAAGPEAFKDAFADPECPDDFVEMVSGLARLMLKKLALDMHREDLDSAGGPP